MCLQTIYFLLFHDVFLMFQTNSIMAKKDIIYLHSNKEGLVSVAWNDIVSATESGIAYNGESLGIYMFIYTLLILYLSNSSKKNYHDKGENEVSAEHIGGLANITLCQMMDNLSKYLGNVCSLCFINMMSS